MKRVVLVREPGKAAEFRAVDMTAEGLEGILGGRADYKRLTKDMMLFFCPEKKNEYNCTVDSLDIYGRAIFAYVKGKTCYDFPGPMAYMINFAVTFNAPRQMRI